AFIGLAVPHVARLLMGTTRHAIIVPTTLLLGTGLLLLCDLIAQLPGKDTTLPINAITALFGAPVVIWLIIRKPYLNRVF
ncbi:MAG TPA: iron ABC transporter, partial [Cytophagales bacterium]|nr:iron ABC transporter [Cytophagales bacterium]